MSEGGFFPWKVQKHVKKPTCDYSGLQNPLPNPPPGMEWHQDIKTREWHLVNRAEPPALVREHANHELTAEDLTQTVGLETCDEDWELLSDRVSSSSHCGDQQVFVARAGSVRSISTVEVDCASASSVPFKIQRTHSSSTIDSCDNALGPSGKGILGVDYVEHVVLPTDTLQGLCLAYKISTTRLRQANHFSGHSLLLAPKKLVIPISKTALRSGFIRIQDTDAKEFKLHAFVAEMPGLSITEAKAYLELADWDLMDAVRSAKEDREWEREMETSSPLKSGQIRITMNMKGGVPVAFSTEGAGIQPKSSPARDKKQETPPSKPLKLIPITDIPSIATKTVNAEDIYKATPQHGNVGVELKDLHFGKDN